MTSKTPRTNQLLLDPFDSTDIRAWQSLSETIELELQRTRVVLKEALDRWEAWMGSDHSRDWRRNQAIREEFFPNDR